MPKFKNEKEEANEVDYEEIDQDKQASLYLAKNIRKRHPIHIEFKISNQVIQIRYIENEPEYTIEKTEKGIIIFLFDIVLLNKSFGEKKTKKIIKV